MRRLARQTRKTLKLSGPLHRDLTRYALAAGAAGVSVLALAPPSAGQIVYTPAHEILERNGTLLIDLNHDGTTDVMIRESYWTPDNDGFFPGNQVNAVTRKGRGIAGSFSGWAYAMKRGSEIGPSNPFQSGRVVIFKATSSGVYYSNGAWDGASNRFLGIRFRIGEETHFGWARLSTRLGSREQGIKVLLSGYAYETQQNTPIRAGDTGGAKEQKSGPASELFSSPKPEEKHAGLGVLALGADGLALLRPAH